MQLAQIYMTEYLEVATFNKYLHANIHVAVFLHKAAIKAKRLAGSQIELRIHEFVVNYGI